MKPRHAATLALLVFASCSPDMATIKAANERAERAAQRAQAAQVRAERSAELAAEIRLKMQDDEIKGQDEYTKMSINRVDACDLSRAAPLPAYSL
jgi:hypothetical protein